jgi:hypothetical protein
MTEYRYPDASPFVLVTNTSAMTTELEDCAPTDLPKLQKTHEGEHHGDYGENIPITRSAFIFAMCAAVNSFNLGYDIGTSTSAGPLVQADMGLTITEREIFVGSLNFWASKFMECFFGTSIILALVFSYTHSQFWFDV